MRRSGKSTLFDIYRDYLLKNGVEENQIMLLNVTKFLLHNIGNRVSPAKIAATLKSQGKDVDQKTVGLYLRGLTDSLMLIDGGA